MMISLMKIHYKAINKNDTIAFVPASDNERFIMYWCWGGDGKIPFILQQLIYDYWVEEGKSIFEKFNQSLVSASEKQTHTGQATAVLVKYIKDVNKSPTYQRQGS